MVLKKNRIKKNKSAKKKVIKSITKIVLRE